jgi:hypothetical protein
MAFGVEPMPSVFDQRDRAVEICDYDFRICHAIPSLKLRNLVD